LTYDGEPGQNHTAGDFGPSSVHRMSTFKSRQCLSLECEVSDLTLEQTGQDVTEHDVTGQDYDFSELDSLDWDMTGEGLVQDWDTIGTAVVNTACICC